MKREMVMQVILTAEEGMYLTNGEVYGKSIFLGKEDSGFSYYEISEEEYQEILKKQEEENP